MIFAIFENLTKENIIPNGFGMSMEEYERHRFKIPGKSNVRFKIENIGINPENIIPIHKHTFKANKNFFKSQGEIYYIISLNRDFHTYSEFFDIGMNSWINFIDETIYDFCLNDGVKIIIVCSIETIRLVELIDFISLTERLVDKRIKYEIWTPFRPPFKNKKMIADVFKEKSKNNPSIAHYTSEELLNHYGKLLAKCEEVVKEYPYWEHETIKHYKSTNLIVNKTKKYINLCRRYTSDRLLTHAYIIENNLLNLGHTSIPDRCMVTGEPLSIRTGNLRSNYPLFQKEIDSANEYWKSNPQGIILDQKPIDDTRRTIYSKDYYGFENPPDIEKYYAESYLSLVNEGDTDLGNFLLTEKIYRSIFYKHMFILIGSYGALECLRERGYRTFDGIWSEDYDLILDDHLRWKTALEQFKWVVTHKKIDRLHTAALPIIEHNYNNMMSRLKRQYKK